jgi:hypothetical protein
MFVKNIDMLESKVWEAASDFLLAPLNALSYDIKPFIRSFDAEILSQGYGLLADTATNIQNAMVRLQITKANERITKLVLAEMTTSHKPQATWGNERITPASHAIEHIERKKHCAPDRQSRLEARKYLFC